jgi:DNA/RNA-binding domain of Phe-tRNA-synthetase-like protein
MDDLEEVGIAEDLAAEFPGLRASTLLIGGVTVLERREELEAYKAEVFARIRQEYDPGGLKDQGPLRAYRDFYWRIGIDPTKVRPASEALLRRTLGGKPIPTINTLVDAYNLASMETLVALAAFDAARVEPPLELRRARPGEAFAGIGMAEPLSLEGREVVGADRSRPIALYPYRDAEESKVTLGTRAVILMVCGVPGIEVDRLRKAGRRARELIERFCL